MSNICRIVQYPGHVTLSTPSGFVQHRALCLDGISVPMATESCLAYARGEGTARVEIYRVDGTRFETGIPS